MIVAEVRFAISPATLPLAKGGSRLNHACVIIIKIMYAGFLKMPSSTIKYLSTLGKRRAWVLSLVVALAVLLAASTQIMWKTDLQLDVPLQVIQSGASITPPAPTAVPDINTATTHSTQPPVVSGRSELFKAILEVHQNTQPVAIAQPAQQHSQTVQGHSDLFKAILDAHRDAQLAVTEQPAQREPQSIQDPSMESAKKQQNASPAFPFISTGRKPDSMDENR